MPVTRGERQARPTTNPVPAVAPKPAAVLPPQSPGAIKTAHEPTAPIKLERPVPALQSHNFQGGINQFNERVQNVHDSYTQAYGAPPSPSLTFDLATSPVDTKDFEQMFKVPQSQFAARNRGTLTAQGVHEVPEPVYSAKELASQIVKAAAAGDYHSFVEQNIDIIHDLSRPLGPTKGEYFNSADAATITGAIFKARRLEAFRDVETKVNNGDLSAAQGREQLQAMGFVPGGASFKIVRGVGGVLATGIGQVVDSLVHSPAGLYELGKAAGLDSRDIVLHPSLAKLENVSQGPVGLAKNAPRTTKIGKAVVKGIKEDVQHPLRNPGYLFLDILGFASPIFSGGVRAAEAGRVLRAGEGVGAAGRALAKKPLQRVTLDHGGFTEEMPLSQNPLVAQVQKVSIERRQVGAAAKLETGDTPSGLLSILKPQIAQDFMDKTLSFPKKLGREADTRKRVDHIIQMTLSRELDAVAGRAVTQARIQSAVPSKLRGALTRGEQKAIQVHSWDDPNPLQAERDFHNRMIEMGVGDPKAHARQLADLKLAEKAMKNPSPRLVEALDLTRRVVADAERIKIQDLGLAAETAEGRVAKAGAVLRGEDITRVEGEGGQFKELRSTDKSKVVDVVPLERVNPDSFYLPTQPRGKVKRPPSDRAGFYSSKAGPFGIPPGRALPELTHEFTGKALMAGDIRIDATSLATEAYGRTVRAATVRAEHSKLWDAASDTKRSRFDVPIRDSNTIPDALRTVIARLDEGDFTAADAEHLPADARKLIEELYPSEEKVASEQIDGVKWVDARLLGEGSTLPHVPGLAARVVDIPNSVLRFITLYLRPGYILNKLGNHGMLWLDQGIHTVPNFIKAMSAESRYGAENTRTIHELVGASKSQSYVTSSSGKISHAVADFWNRVADRDERTASFIHYMELKGYKTRAQVDSLLHDPAKRADLVEITRRGNKALVEFDNLTPIEKNYIRHFIFVYPWVSRSAVYSIRAILEHPTKVDLLSHLGRQDFEDDPIFKNAPAWFKRTGYIPVGWNADGTPRVVNPTSVNTFSTLGDFMALGRAVTVGDKYSSAADFLGPFPKYLMHAVSGRDDQGNQYPGSQWGNAAKDVLMQLPQIAALERKGKYKPGDDRKIDIANRASLETALNANLKKTVLTPGWLDGYGSFFAGGLSPRDVNLDALTARYWKDQDPKVRHERELNLLNRALNIQADALGKSVPKAVKSAVSDQANLDYAYKTFLKDTGRAPTDKERAGFTLDYLHKQGLVSDDDRKKFAATLKPLADPSDISRFKGMLLDKYANGKALRQWDTDIRALASFTPEIVNQKAGELFKQGLVPQKAYKVSQETLYDYGRKYVQFTHDAQELQKKVKDGTATTADMRAFTDLHDKPVNGLPSFVRMAWANLTKDEQQQATASNVTASWNTLTAFDKTLLGRPSDAKVTAGWAKLKEITDQQSTILKREGRSWPAGYSRTLAQYVEKYYDAPGLTKDYDFSKQPLYARMKYLAPIQKSPNQALWTQVLNQAAAMHKYLAQKDDLGGHVYNTTQVRQSWKDYVDSPGFQSWLGENPSFKAELGSYGRSTLVALVS